MREYRNDRASEYAFDLLRGAPATAKAATAEEQAEARTYQVRQDVESAVSRAKRLGAIVTRSEWREEKAKLDKDRTNIETKLSEREADSAASPKASTHIDAARTKLRELITLLEDSKEPRAVPPISGELEIEPSVVDRSASVADLLAFAAGLSAKDRSALRDRLQRVNGTGYREDGFAVVLANSLAAQRAMFAFFEVLKNPRRFNRAKYDAAKSANASDAATDAAGDAESAPDATPAAQGDEPARWEGQIVIDRPPSESYDEPRSTIDDAAVEPADQHATPVAAHSGGSHGSGTAHGATARPAATRSPSARGGMGDLRMAEAGLAPAPPGPPDTSGPGAAFLRQFSADMVHQAPKPLLLDQSSAGSLAIFLLTPEPLPGTTPVSVWCKVIDPDEQAVVETGATWLPGMLGPPLNVTVPRPGDYRVRVFLNAGRSDERIVTRKLEVRTPDLDAARNLSDDELTAQRQDVDRALATETDPARRDAMVKGRNEMEWLAHERGLLQPQTEKADEWEGLPSEPLAMRHYLERRIAKWGVEWTRQRVYDIAYNTYDAEYTLALEQLDIIQAEEEAFRADLRANAHRAAEDILDTSEAEIAAVLESYGLANSKRLLSVTAQFQQHPHGNDLDLAIETVMRLSKGAKQGAKFDDARPSREGLGAAARELRELQVNVRSLQEQYEDLAGSNPPIPAGQPSSTEAEGFARVAELGGRVASAKTALQVRWLELEQMHPVLAAFRSGDGDAENANVAGVAQGDEEAATRGMLAQVLPKVANIYKLRGKLGRDVNAMELPPAVELAKQRMHVPPGSVRDGIADREVAAARDGDEWKDWAIGALTVGLALATAIPSGGSSLGVAAAELTALAVDAYLVMEAVDEYDIDKAASNTALDRARSLSQEEPSLAWLAVQLVMLAVSAGFARQTFREAAGLRRAIRAGEASEEAIEHLDEVGRAHGIGDIGTRVANEAQVGGDVARAGARGAKGARPLFDDSLGELASHNVDALSRRVGVPVDVDDALGSGVRIDWRVNKEDEFVDILAIRIGNAASTADVLAHQQTMRLLRRYNGAWGRLRRLLDEILAMFRGGAAAPGSDAFKAQLEVEKLLRIAEHRRNAMLASGDEAAAVLEREALFLEEQAAQFADIARAAERDAVAGAHSTAMPDTTRIRSTVGNAEERSREVLDEFAQRQRGGFGEASGEVEDALYNVDVEDLKNQRRRDRRAASYPGNNAQSGHANYFPPKSAGPEFDAWFDAIPPADFAKLWDDEAAQKAFKSALRGDGGNHEWLMVAEARRIKEWGVSIVTVKSAVTRTDAVIGRMAANDGGRIVFRHGGEGSRGGTFHRQLQRMIRSSGDYGEFLTKLNQWADDALMSVPSTRWPDAPRLGRYALPDDLQLRGEGGLQ